MHAGAERRFSSPAVILSAEKNPAGVAQVFQAVDASLHQMTKPTTCSETGYSQSLRIDEPDERCHGGGAMMSSRGFTLSSESSVVW